MATNAHAQFGRLIKLLLRQQKASEQSYSASALETYHMLTYSWKFLNDQMLDNYEWSKDGLSIDLQESRLVLPLPPLKRDASFVPILAFEYHSKQPFEESCLRMHVLMVRHIECKLVGLGFRIESPERNCQESGSVGVHDFYHAQLIKCIGYGPAICVPEWLPCSQPSFPLWATNPIDAILNLILTLYGRRYYRDFVANLKETDIAGMSDEFQKFHERLQSGQ